MARSKLSRVLRRAVLAHLSVAVPVLMGCGGATSPSYFDAGAGADAYTVPLCSVDKTFPPVARARRRAAWAVVRNAGRAVHPEIVQELGLPTAGQARGLAVDLDAALWGTTQVR